MNRFQNWYGMQPRGLRTLIAINVIFYVLWILFLSRFGATAGFVVDHLALHPHFPAVLFEPWQLITYNFIHLGTGFWGGLLHILFNMLWLYWIGAEYEQLHGPAPVTAIYLLGGIGGGLLSLLFFSFVPSGPVVIHGASASVLGVITAVATLYPQKRIGLMFIGVVRLVWLVVGFLVIDILFASGTAVAAHLGGAATGFLFARLEQRGVNLSSWARVFYGQKRTSQSSVNRRGGQSKGWFSKKEPVSPRKKSTREAPLRSVSHNGGGRAAEVDRILDKISDQGYEALTEEEKRVLYEASKRG